MTCSTWPFPAFKTTPAAVVYEKVPGTFTVSPFTTAVAVPVNCELASAVPKPMFTALTLTVGVMEVVVIWLSNAPMSMLPLMIRGKPTPRWSH